ncbi:TPA: tyrosine-type recombinase/integrase [Legionella pneumophila subsp. pneumophila]|uniref:tyrosine-type recombinase/integrase n=1 Tax=Legionella pneumophila TaxID=446 RepID=UPI0007707DBB|nr:site-specific integrase [Legionella pneumophila]HAT8850752.1 tyrosine-type recombinase/integrase [Legionella pneumophila subsp. pneumophila]CZI81542.1 Tyrosine recombinase XerC [Legionella pneumophila]CZI83385.1 Tyrosine recombinase XerC [Legionella pneumophila]HAT9170698.1 tyrosine-type recombinase/integrase [Legionella pneumophila subsp. pneumophila]HDP0036719.1 site-specific integrase [Legionella pneumophila]
MATIEQRITKDGKCTYRVKVRIKGFPTQQATFDRKTDARKWAQQTEVAIRERKHFKTSEAKRRTLGEMIERYIKEVIPQKPKNSKNTILHLRWWQDELGQYSLADVSPALIAEKRDKLSSGITKRNKLRSPSTVVRYLAALSHAFTMAVKEWGWIDDSPMRRVTKPKEPRGRVRFLSDDERNRLLEECNKSESQYLYIAVVLALSTGARKMELMGLRWKDIDFDRQVIILHETKNGERRILPLTGRALELINQLAKIRRLNCDFVFPNHEFTKPIDLRTPFETAVKRAGITDFRWHDLRHSCASYLAMNNASLAEIAEILGHKTLQMVKRYAHLSDAHTSKVVASMNEKIFNNNR